MLILANNSFLACYLRAIRRLSSDKFYYASSGLYEIWELRLIYSFKVSCESVIEGL